MTKSGKFVALAGVVVAVPLAMGLTLRERGQDSIALHQSSAVAQTHQSNDLRSESSEQRRRETSAPSFADATDSPLPAVPGLEPEPEVVFIGGASLVDVGGAKILDFRAFDNGCEPEELEILRDVPNLMRVYLPAVSGDEHVRMLSDLQSIEELWIGWGGTDDGLLVIDTLPRLHTLWSDSLVGLRGFAALGRAGELESLRFTSASADPADYAHLSKLERLRELTVELAPGAGSDDVLAELAKLKSVRTLKLVIDSRKVTDAGIQQLWKLPNVRSFTIKLGKECAKLTPRVFDGIAEMSELRELVVHPSSSSFRPLPPHLRDARTYAGIGEATQLEVLGLPWLDPPGLESLAGLTNLRKLAAGNPVVDENLDLSKIKSLSKLESIDFNGGASGSIPTSGIPHLVHFPKLRAIDLSYHEFYAPFRIDDDDVEKYLSQLFDLVMLQLRNQPVTDDGLLHLRNLHELRNLWLMNTQTTEAGRNRLRDALPEATRENLKIYK